MERVSRVSWSAALRWKSLIHWMTRRTPPVATLVAMALLTVALSACGDTAPKLPAGVYTNQQYHFRVTYPSGWQVNTSSQPGATAPLIVIITRSGTPQPGSQISSMTIDVLDMSNAGVKQTAAALSKNNALSKTTFGGQPAFSDSPTKESGASVTLIHQDYYVVDGSYLYQVSTDALSGDASALDTMAQSFTLLS